MRIAIIGAGFTGLSAAYNLLNDGHSVDVYEADTKPGGLAIGFREKRWEWSLEAHYHHWFTSDDAVRKICEEIGQKIIFIRPKTSTLIDKDILQLDSPRSLLQFGKLKYQDRIRTGAVLGYLRLTPFWRNLEHITARDFLIKWMGEESWKVLWQPLFIKKFGTYYKGIPASWFWARIKKRSPTLGYPEGGFQKFADMLADEIIHKGGRIFYKTPVKQINKKDKQVVLSFFTKEESFDGVICTLPSALFLKLTPKLEENYKNQLLNLQGLSAINLILSLKQQFLTDGTYWLNINNLNYPVLAIVEHTNFMDKNKYNNEHLIYIGNYLDTQHKYMKMTPDQLLKEYMPFLTKINSRFDRSWINRVYAFKAPFAQPVIPLNYSQIIPSMSTPIKGLYLANMQQVYPWDRGTNYAVEMGKKVADLVIKEGLK